MKKVIPMKNMTWMKAFGLAILLSTLALVACGGGGGGTTSSATPVTQLGAVAALFPTNGANWNDYVAGDASTATDVACNAASDISCLHGGERRVVVATGMTTCGGLTAADDLKAFTWVCDASTSPVRFVSTGLASGKSLSDLVDFATPGFKSNKVTVYVRGSAWGATPSSIWWSNPVVINNTGGSFAAASTIYLVTSNPVANNTIDADKVALVVEPGVTLTGPGTNTYVVWSSTRNYLWIEGSIDATNDGNGVYLNNVHFSMLSRFTADNAGSSGIYLDGATNNTLSNVNASNNYTGVTLNSTSNKNALSDVTVTSNYDGFDLPGASNNTLVGISTSNNSNYGIFLSNATNNTLTSVTASNNSIGVQLSNATNNTLSGVTASNNGKGFVLFSSSNNTLNDMTANNNGDGVYLYAATNNTLSGVTASNNGIGIHLDINTGSNLLSDMTASNNGTGIFLGSTLTDTFIGLLKVGNNSMTDCYVDIGAYPTLTDGTCAYINPNPLGTLIHNITLANAFVGKVTSDAANASDIAGTATFPLPAAFDWTHFDNNYRGWGIDGSAFPDAAQQGRWTTGNGRIWDWSLLAADTVNRAALTLPTGNDTFTQSWYGTPTTSDNAGCNTMVAGSVWNNTGSVCQTTFLKNAVEIPTDGVGNHNGLCESGETCLYTPNIGSYQGHGNLVSAGTFTDGTLTGITLMEFATNGE
jgi:parallel beta-helix repeat protein